MRRSALVACCAFCTALNACSDAKRGGPNVPPVSGVVQGRSAAALQGAVATILQVQPDGSTQPVSDPAPLDGNGHYVAPVTFAGETASDLIVQIQSNGQTVTEAIVSAPVSHGATVTAPPASMTTLTQTRVFLDARTTGLWDANATTAGLRALVDAPTAAAVAANGAADVHHLALGVIAALDARAGMLVNMAGSGSGLPAFLDSETAAQATEDAALDAATSPVETNAAIQARAAATLSAATATGLSLGQYEQMARAEAVAYASASNNVSTDVAAPMMTSAALLEATAVIAADSGALGVLGATHAITTDLSSAAMLLPTAIAASAGSPAAIATAWETYETAALSDLKAAAAGVHKDGDYEIDSVTNALSSAQRTAVNGLATVTTTTALIQTLATFAAATQQAVTAQLVLSTFVPPKLDAVVSTLLSIELRGGASPPLGGAITGRLETPPAATVTVTAYQTTMTGTMMAVSQPATVDSTGRYTVQVTTPAVTDAIVIATSGGATLGKAIVSGTIPSGGSITARPIGQQSTVEADLFLSALAHGYWSGVETTAALRGYVSSDLAAALASSTTYDADIQLAAKMIIAGIDGRQAVFAIPAVGVGPNAVDQFLSAEIEAQQAEDVALDGATSASQIQNAAQARRDAVLASAAAADISPAQFSLATLAATKCAQATSSGLSPVVATPLQAGFEVMEAHFLAKANTVELNAFTVNPSVLSDMSSAGATLESNVGSGATAAWTQYDQTAQNDLQSTADAAVSGGAAAVQAVISNCMSAQSTLQSQLGSAGSDAKAIAQALAAFASNIQSSVSGNATLGTLGSAEVNAISCVIVNLDAAN